MSEQIPLYVGIPLAILCIAVSAAVVAFFIDIMRHR